MEEYEGIGGRYQRLTRYVRGSLPRRGFGSGAQPSLRKAYKKPLKVIDPPPPKITGGPPLWETIRARRSVRSYKRQPMSLAEVSQLLWATQGNTVVFRGYPYRSAPSAGALYPVETYLVVNRVEGLDPGLYHYDAVGAALQFLKEGSLGAQAAAAALDQPMAEQAAVVFIWTAIIERGKWKYLERAYRYIYLDAGHIGQNLYLAATGMGLGCCAMGAFYDDEVDHLLGVDGEREFTIYLCSVGKL